MNWGSILFTNLNLLGFDPEPLEKICRTKLAKGLFSSPNRKALELILYFLFENLDINKCYNVFSDCYPVISKKQESSFSRVANTWLMEISKEAGLPQYSPSLLISPCGGMVYELLSKLSTFVMSRRIVSKFGQSAVSILKRPLGHGDAVSLLLKASLHRELCEFLNIANLTTKEFKEFQVIMRGLVEEYRHLTQICIDFDLQLHELHRNYHSASKMKGRPFPSQLPTSDNPTPNNYDEYLKFRKHRIQKLTYQWDKLLGGLSKLSPERAVIAEILHKPDNSTILRADDIDLNIPDALYCREKDSDLHDNVITKGKLNIEVFLRLGIAALRHLVENLGSLSPSNEDDTISAYSKISSTLERHKSIHNQLEEVAFNLESLMTEMNDFAANNSHLCDRLSLPENDIPSISQKTNLNQSPLNNTTKMETNFEQITDWNAASAKLDFKTPKRPPPKSRFASTQKSVSSVSRLQWSSKSEKTAVSAKPEFIPLDFSSEEYKTVPALKIDVLSPMSSSDTSTNNDDFDEHVKSLSLSHSPIDDDTSSVTSLTNQNEDDGRSSSLLPYLVATPRNSVHGDRSSMATRTVGPTKHFSLEMDSGSSVDEDNNWLNDVTDSLPPPRFSRNWMKSPTELLNRNDAGVEEMSDSFLVP